MEKRDFETKVDVPSILRDVASRVLKARLPNGARVLDATDCSEWLISLAKEWEKDCPEESFLPRSATAPERH